MSTYAIGDVQGCYSTLQLLLKKINYNSENDYLWFVGDLINRGPESLQTLLFIKNLVTAGKALTILGNHDLHLLAVAENFESLRAEDTIQDILNSEYKEDLLYWLRQQPLCHYDPELNFFMIHAGLIPNWSIADALRYSKEVTEVLKNEKMYRQLLKNMYGDEPKQWSEQLLGEARLRFIINVCTRLRFCTEAGEMDLKNKGVLGSQSKNMLPWFKIVNRQSVNDRIIFGHWAALYPDWDQVKSQNLFPIDSGCIWGNGLTAMCLDTKEYFWVPSE